ncbi:MAG: glycosyltransferase, partial [Gammaproteobacteria bacterium]
ALKWQGIVPAGMKLTQVPVRSLSRTGLYRRYTRWVQAELNKSSCVVGFNKMPGLDVYFAADACFEEKAQVSRGAYYKFTSRYRHFRNYERAVFGPGSHTEVLVLSGLQRQGYLKHYPHCAERLHELPPGVAADRRIGDQDSSLRQVLRDELKLDPRDLLVLQLGSGFRVKGVDRSLRAIASLPGHIRTRVKYLLVGQDRAAPFKRLAEKLGIAAQVIVSPGRNDVPSLLAGADLLLHPAYEESAGYVLLEATIAGLPVLTTASCGYAVHIEQAQSGQVCSLPFRQEELNQRLLNMLQELDTALWSENGLAYGNNDALYAMPTVAVDLIEQFAQRRDRK